jgi:hypothetical protein
MRMEQCDYCRGSGRMSPAQIEKSVDSKLPAWMASCMRDEWRAACSALMQRVQVMAGSPEPARPDTAESLPPRQRDV